MRRQTAALTNDRDREKCLVTIYTDSALSCSVRQLPERDQCVTRTPPATHTRTLGAHPPPSAHHLAPRRVRCHPRDSGIRTVSARIGVRGGPVAAPPTSPPAPAGPGSPVRTAGRTAREAHRRGGGRAEPRSPLLARQRTRAETPAAPIEFPIEKPSGRNDAATREDIRVLKTSIRVRPRRSGSNARRRSYWGACAPPAAPAPAAPPAPGLRARTAYSASDPPLSVVSCSQSLKRGSLRESRGGSWRHFSRNSLKQQSFARHLDRWSPTTTR
jgi:hypothetical protein